MTSYQGMLDHLASALRPERLIHVLGVTHTAVQLAARHGLDIELSAAAGLIHDRSKEIPPARIEEDLLHRGIEIPEEDRPFPAIWHGLHAAVWLRQDAGWASGPGLDSLARAVEYHSTAEADLDPLGQLLFVADYLEPGRFFEGIEELRQLATRDLEMAYKSCLAAKCRYVIQKRQQSIHPRAIRAMKSCGMNFDVTVGEMA